MTTETEEKECTNIYHACIIKKEIIIFQLERQIYIYMYVWVCMYHNGICKT